MSTLEVHDEFENAFPVQVEGRYAGLVCSVRRVENYEYNPDDPNRPEDDEYNPRFDEEYIEILTPDTMVTVYSCHRVCGGPAEGGDWYNRYDPVVSIPLINPGDREEILEVARFLRKRFPDEGNIYSVLGGVEYHIMSECTEGMHKTAPYRGYE